MQVNVRGHQGIVIIMRFLKEAGPFCRTCGTAKVRDMTARTLIQGWWGFGSFFITLFVLLANRLTLRKINKLPPPGPSTTGTPLDPGKPLLRRPAALGLLVPVALIVLITIGILADSGNVRNAEAGDCISGADGRARPKIVDCASPEAAYKVLANIEGRTGETCHLWPDAIKTYTQYGTDDRPLYTLCLAPAG